MSFLQYSNVYIPTPEINQLIHDKKLQEECLHYVGKKGREILQLKERSGNMSGEGNWSLFKTRKPQKKKIYKNTKHRSPVKIFEKRKIKGF